MAELLASGRLIELIMLLLALEAAGLVALHRFFGLGPAPADLLPNIAAGLFLFLAIRLVLAETAWPLIAAALGLAFVAHLWDLRRRWPMRHPSS